MDLTPHTPKAAVAGRAGRKIEWAPEQMQYHRLLTEGDCPAALKCRYVSYIYSVVDCTPFDSSFQYPVDPAVD